jgi:hypothetical protein
MGNWDNFKNVKSGGSGDILKLEDGKAVKIRVLGEPWVYTSEYKDQISTRFALTVYNQTDSKAQILMIPRTAFGMIYDLVENADWGDPDSYDITIKRTGTGLDTEYSVAPSPKTKLDADKQAEVESIILDDVLSRLPSVKQAFALSQVTDMEMLLPKQTKKVETKEADPEMPPDFLN